MLNPSNSYDISKNNWSDSNLFPDQMYLDTNLAVTLIKRDRDFYKIEHYLQEYTNRKKSVYWSRHTEKELYDCLHVDTLKSNSSKYGYQPNQWKVMENEISNSESVYLAQITNSRFDNAIQTLKQYGDLLDLEPENLFKDTRTIYSAYGGNRKDAEHLAFANAYGINNILTNDSSNGNGFFRYPNQNIYGFSKVISDLYVPGKTTNSFQDLFQEATSDDKVS